MTIHYYKLTTSKSSDGSTSNIDVADIGNINYFAEVAVNVPIVVIILNPTTTAATTPAFTSNRIKRKIRASVGRCSQSGTTFQCVSTPSINVTTTIIVIIIMRILVWG